MIESTTDRIQDFTFQMDRGEGFPVLFRTRRNHPSGKDYIRRSQKDPFTKETEEIFNNMALWTSSCRNTGLSCENTDL